MAKTQSESESGTFDGLEADLEVTAPVVADGDLTTDITLSQDGVQETINIVFAIDTSGSTRDRIGEDLNGDGQEDTVLDAQILAVNDQLQALVDAGYDPASINVTIVDFDGDASSFTATLEDVDQLQDYVNNLESSGRTNFEDALETVEDALDAIPDAENSTNIVYFYSDGEPFPSGQDFETPLESLEDAYSPIITAVGFGDQADENVLDIIDSSGDATIILTIDDLLGLGDTPPPLPDVDSFEIFVDGVLIETIPFGDPRIVISATGLTINNLDVSGYPVSDGSPQTINLEVKVNFSNGDDLTVDVPIKIIDGEVEGTDGDDLIDADYDGDPEGDKVDNDDNVNGPPEDCNDDVIFAGDGDDTVNAGEGDDLVSGGDGDDTFIEVAGDGSDTITDFGEDDSGSINDGDQSNNDFVDLSAFYNQATLDAVNNADGDPSNDFGNAIGMLRADAADGKLDGIINGVDYSDLIGDIDLTLLDGNGNAVTGTDLTFDNTNVVCFARGTRIATRDGSIAIEDLKVGDEVITMDHGFQKIRWLGSTTVPAAGHLAPVVIRKGAMGNERDLRVSPQHRMLVRGWHVELLFDQKEALVPAKALINDETVFQLEGGTVDYFHMMFDRHELVYAEGIPSESFHPGHVGVGSFSEDTRDEIFELFPELRTDLDSYSEHVRPSLKVREAKVLAENPELMKD